LLQCTATSRESRYSFTVIKREAFFFNIKLFKMKKLKLSAMHHRGIEVLSREQMKHVLGKMMGGSEGDGNPSHEYLGCGHLAETGQLICEYRLTYASGAQRELCDAQCIGSDGAECM
jgi:hypothetical protein